MKKLIWLIFNTVSYLGTDKDTSNTADNDSTIILNQYLFLLCHIFLLHGIFSIVFIRDQRTNIILFAISFLFFLCVFIPPKIRQNEYVISFFFVFLTSLVTYYSSLCGIESGIFLFYFSLISALQIFFSWKKHKFFIIFLLFIIILQLYASASTTFKLVDNDNKYVHFRCGLLLMNITFLLLILALNSFFFYRKIQNYYFILNRDLNKSTQINNLNQEVLRLKRILNKDVFSEATLKDLMESVQLNETIFLEKFEVFFPGLFDSVQKISEQPLTGSDLKMCAMLKLGFTSKQIAIYTNSSIKSVEGKIYRLRKKLKITAEEDSKAWFIAL